MGVYRGKKYRDCLLWEEQQSCFHCLLPDLIGQVSDSTPGIERETFLALNFQSQLEGIVNQ